MATDLAEFLGAALGFNLLFHIPLFPAALLTAVATFLILGLQRYGFRPLEAVITVMVGRDRGLLRASRRSSSNPDWGAIAREARHAPDSTAPRASCWRSASSARPSCRT